MIISPVWSFEDVAQGIYDTARLTSIASEYGCDVYANVLEKIHQKQLHKKILSSLYSVRTQDTLVDAVYFQRRYRQNPFVLDDAYLTPFFQRVQSLSVQHMVKITLVNVILKVSYLSQV